MEIRDANPALHKPRNSQTLAARAIRIAALQSGGRCRSREAEAWRSGCEDQRGTAKSRRVRRLCTSNLLFRCSQRCEFCIPARELQPRAANGCRLCWTTPASPRLECLQMQLLAPVASLPLLKPTSSRVWLRSRAASCKRKLIDCFR